MLDTISGGAAPEMLESWMKSWTPMGEAGMGFWRSMFETAAKPR
jgi:hypothetical protein